MIQLSESQFRLGVVVLGAILVFVLTTLRFGGGFALPGMSEKPREKTVDLQQARQVSDSIEQTASAFDLHVQRDIKKFGLTAASASTRRELSLVFPYKADLSHHTLEVGDTIKVQGISMTLHVEKVPGSKRKHMILALENTQHRAVAYRVKTRPSSGSQSCSRMSHLPHNAIALAAGAKQKRSECVFRKGWKLEITSVETIRVPELSYHYLSSLSPQTIGLAKRVSDGHRALPASLKCSLPNSGSLRKAIAEGTVTWHDQVDYFARHRCASYRYLYGYQAFKKNAEHSLPVLGQ